MFLRNATPLRRLARFQSDPFAAQRRLLVRLLREAERTEWGRRLGFTSILSSPDPVRCFQERVPIHAYDDFREDIDRIRRGARDVIWPGAFRHFAVSGGTTARGKIIPLSQTMLKKDRDFGLSAGLSYARSCGNLQFLRGHFLSVPGRVEPDPLNDKNLIGEVSGLVALYSPWYVRRFREAVDHDILFLPDWKDKLNRIVDRTRTMDIRSIAMVPSWAIVLFPMLIERHNELTGDTVRYVSELWPRLQIYFSGGVALSSYRSILEGQIGGSGIDFIESYGASEGFFSFQDTLSDPGMLLHLDNGVFFEFIRMDDTSQPPRRYILSEVETDVRYELLVSSCSGLWAYRVGDIIRFTSTDPHRIVVAGRTSEMLDLYGEAVFGEEARDALNAACRASGATIKDYHVSPLAATEKKLPGHEWLVEFDKRPDDLNDFSRAIDTHLQRVNRHYTIRREAGAFSPPIVIEVPDGAFYSWLMSTRERVSAQTKVPRMSENRTIARSILDICGKNR